jgi:serine/threonine-protein phosphatase 6 regulatory ankyrin repeat subunit A
MEELHRIVQRRSAEELEAALSGAPPGEASTRYLVDDRRQFVPTPAESSPPTRPGPASATPASATTMSASASATASASASASAPTPTIRAGGSSWTLLLQAVHERWIRGAALLLRYGADVDAADARGWTALHHACVLGSAHMAAFLVASGASPYARTLRGAAALHLACFHDQPEIVAKLLAAASPPPALSDPCADGWPPLHYAASAGATACVRLLLDAGTPVATRDFLARTALHLAVSNEHVETALLLLERGAPAAACNSSGESALHLAALRGCITLVDALVHDAGVDVHLASANGDTPLHYAAGGGHATTCARLLDAGAAVDAANALGSSPLHVAISQLSSDSGGTWASSRTQATAASSADRLSSAEFLLKCNANPLMQDLKGRTPLHLACHVSNSAGAKLLITRSERSLTVPDNKRRTPLHAAAASGNDFIVGMILDASAAVVDCEDRDGRTAMHYAAAHGWMKVADVLLASRASLTVKDVFEMVPLHLAARYGHLDLVKRFVALMDHLELTDRSGLNVLHHAALGGHHSVVEVVLAVTGSDALRARIRKLCSGCSASAWTPLHVACSVGAPRCVEVLLSNGADIHGKDERMRNALHHAAIRGDHDCAELLLQKGCVIEATDDSGMCAHHYAAAFGHAAVLSRLARTAPLDYQTSHGTAAIHLAALSKSDSCVTVLRERGANMLLRDQNGWSALHHAAYVGAEGVLAMLLGYSIQDPTARLLGSTSPKIGGHGSGVVMRQFRDRSTVPAEDAEDNATMACDQLSDPAFSFSSPAGELTNADLIALVDQRDNLGVTPLFKACLGGHIGCVRMLVRTRHVDVNARCGPNEVPVLHAGLISGSLAVVKMLLAAGATPDSCSKTGESSTQISARCSSAECLRYLLGRLTPAYTARVGRSRLQLVLAGAGDSPLHIATALERIEHAKLLLEIGVPLRAVDSAGRTAVHLACERGNVELLRLFFQHGCDLSVGEARTGSTPLHIAAARGHSSCVELLLMHNAPPNLSNVAGRTPLHEAIAAGHEDCALALISFGAAVSESDRQGRNALHYASFYAAARMARAVVQNVVQNRRMSTMLWYSPDDGAVAPSSAEDSSATRGTAGQPRPQPAARLLAEMTTHGLGDNDRDSVRCGGSDRDEDLSNLVNAKSVDGASPLQLAVVGGSEEIIRLLLRNGAEVFACNDCGRSALHEAAELGKSAILDLLIDMPGSEEVLIIADSTGCTPLHLAAGAGHALCVLSLLLALKRSGLAEQELRRCTISGRTAIALALQSESVAVINALVEGGALLEEPIGEEQFTALLFACANFRTDAIALALLALGANVCAMDRHGRTTALVAAEAGLLPLAITLIRAGSPMTAKDADGVCVVDALVRKGSIDVKDAAGHNLVHLALEMRDLEALGYILTRYEASHLLQGASVRGLTPMQFAVDADYEQGVSFLASHGCLDSRSPVCATTPFRMALESGRTDLAVLLMNAGANPRESSRPDDSSVTEVRFRAAVREFLRERESDIVPAQASRWLA